MIVQLKLNVDAKPGVSSLRDFSCILKHSIFFMRCLLKNRIGFNDNGWQTGESPEHIFASSRVFVCGDHPIFYILIHNAYEPMQIRALHGPTPASHLW